MVFLAGLIVLYIRACTYATSDESLDGAAESPAFDPG